MSELDDYAWREGARSLGLALLDASGRKVRYAGATRRNEMLGTVDSRRVRVLYGFQSPNDRITVIDIRLRRPLLLGAHVEVSAPPRTSTGVVLPGGVQMHIAGVDRDRVLRLLDTESGRELQRQIFSLGSLGYTELRDRDLHAQCEFLTDHPAGYVSLVRHAMKVASLAEAARQELGMSPFETAAFRRLGEAAGELQLDFDESTLCLSGAVRRLPVRLELRVERTYAILCRVSFPCAFPEGASVRRRKGLRAHIAALLRLDAPTGHYSFDRVFCAAGTS